MSFIADLKSKAESELTALKNDARSVEERIEEAFGLGATQSKLDAIINDNTSVEAKVKAAFELGKSIECSWSAPADIALNGAWLEI